jgi:hypothetical protein
MDLKQNANVKVLEVKLANALKFKDLPVRGL